jgi:putative membrane protein
MDFNINYIKALHIVFVVTWFAGLFYIVRLFIYLAEAQNEEEPKKSILSEQYRLMQKRLWFGITWPSAILASTFGIWMYIYNFEAYLTAVWMLLKLIFVGLLWIYHVQCHIIFKQQKKGIFKFSSIKLRLWNEVATILLFAIVFLVVIKSTSNVMWIILGLFILTGLLLLGIFVYKRQREKQALESAPPVKKEEEQKNPPADLSAEE